MPVGRQIMVWFLGCVALAGLAAIAVDATHVLPVRESGDVALTPGDWFEVAWPLPRDQFGAGKAFECAGVASRTPVRVTFRAKIGYCNCATGVSDDEELERIGDVALVGANYAAGRPGREISVGRMKGRGRPYLVRDGSGEAPMLSIAFNDRCDVIVATATGADAVAREDEILAFLNSPPVLSWAERALGL